MGLDATLQIEGLDCEHLAAQLTPEELRTFQRTATSDSRQLFEAALMLEHRQWINRLFRGPIIVRLNRDQDETKRLMIRFQAVRDCVLPDDCERLAQSDPHMSHAALDEATTRLWNLWKAEGRPSIFEVV